MTRTPEWQALRYDLAMYLRSGVLAALLIAGLVPWVFWLPADSARRVSAALAMCETFVVVAAPFLLGGLVSREHEERTAEILLCRAAPRYRLIGTRVLIGLVAVVLLSLIPVVSYGVRGVALPISQVLTATLPGAFCLGALSLTVGALTRSTAAAFLVPAAYWFFDWGTRGAHTGYLTLFARSLGKAWWPTSKLGLMSIACISLIIAVRAVGARD